MPSQTRKRAITDAQWKRWDKRARDTILFALGIATAVNELFIQQEPRYITYPIIGFLIGAPLAFWKDDTRAAEHDERAHDDK